ncbi:MAG: hypothetical protein JXC85_04115 [Candidatus Aenigmarchaeota archaeon]|nr:hypothetical protein [Candidatus Aenigmarchaeota archaeon]
MTETDFPEEYKRRLEKSYEALCRRAGPSFSTTRTVISHIFGSDTAERAEKALSKLPSENFGHGRKRCQDPWIALQRNAVLAIHSLGISEFEKICYRTVSKIEEGAYSAGTSDYMDHHMAGPVSVVTGEDVMEYRQESINNAKRYLIELGIL